MAEFTETIIADDIGDITAGLSILSSTGGCLIVEEGDYELSSALSVDSDITIIGRGAVKLWSDNNISAFYISGKGRITITGFEIEMKNNNYSQSVIYLSGSANCRFENLTIYYSGTSTGSHRGITLTNSSEHNIVSKCNIKGFETGIKIYGSKHNIIQSCSINDGDTNITNYGIVLENESEHNIVSNCVITDLYGSGAANAYSGIYVHDSNYNGVTGNVVTDCGNMGIYLRSSEGTVISGNVCNNNAGDGILLSGDSSENKTKYTTVTGNACADNGDTTGENDITIKQYSEYNSIVGNACYDGNDYEIKLDGSSSYFNLAVGNNCADSSGRGDVVYPRSGGNIVTSNVD